MALVDQLMGKPMEAVAPLTGAPETYQKAVQTSYEIAQNQEKLRIANEQLGLQEQQDRKSTRLNSSHIPLSRMPSSA